MTPSERQSADYRLFAMHDGPSYNPQSMLLWQIAGALALADTVISLAKYAAQR